MRAARYPNRDAGGHHYEHADTDVHTDAAPNIDANTYAYADQLCRRLRR